MKDKNLMVNLVETGALEGKLYDICYFVIILLLGMQNPKIDKLISALIQEERSKWSLEWALNDD
jgi:hypothetical protein